MARDEYDVIIVGARVAGSVLAAKLGDAGYRVLLVDRASFPSSTLSTHFFRGAGAISVFKSLDVLDEVLGLRSPPLTREYWYKSSAEQPRVAAPQDPGEIGYNLSVRREPLDHILLKRAIQAPSVDLIERTRVTELLWNKGRVIGARLVSASGEQDVRARIVVGADGRHSFVAGAVNAQMEESEPGNRALYYHYVRGFAGIGNSEPDGPEFSLLEDEIAYVFPSDDGVTCVAISINLNDFGRLRRSADKEFRNHVAQHPGISRRFFSATEEGRLQGCGPMPNYVRIPTGPGWALVGDAGLHQDPFTGLGIDLASMHATFLAAALLSWLGGSMSEEDALASYHGHRNEHALPGYHQTVALARDLRQLQS